MTFGDRIALARDFENEVADMLTLHGWTVERFGQELLGERTREILRRTETPLRWLPDLFVDAGHDMFFVDAKNSSASKTGNHAVETASSHCMSAFTAFSGMRVFYAFPHDGHITLVDAADWMHVKRPAKFRGDGSGTLFDIAACSLVCPPVRA